MSEEGTKGNNSIVTIIVLSVVIYFALSYFGSSTETSKTVNYQEIRSSVGMTKDQFIERFGKPNMASDVENTTWWWYSTIHPDSGEKTSCVARINAFGIVFLVSC